MLAATYIPDTVTLGLGLLVVRVILGGLIAAHGAQKLFGWFGGYGIAGTAGYFENLGFRPGRWFVITASVAEVVSGILVVSGLFGPIGPALMLSTMIVAAVSVHWKNGVFASKNGIELPLLYATAAVALGFTGPGLFSLDAVLHLDQVWSAGLKAAVLAIGALGGGLNLLARRPPAATASV